jgi:nucleolar protein 53
LIRSNFNTNTLFYFSGVIAQKDNEDLFFIDTKGKNAQNNYTSFKPIKKTLKIDQILKPESAYTIGRTYQAKGSKAEEALIVKKTKAITQSKPVTTKRVTGSATLYDVWGDEETATTVTETETKAKKSKFVPVIPAVPVPVAATSYNPSPEEHLIHLESLEAHELARLARNEAFKERLPLAEVSSAVAASSDLVAIANRKLALGEFSDEEGEEEKNGKDKEGIFLGSSTQTNRKKSLQDRKRQRRHKELMAEQRSRGQEKTLLKSIERAPEILSKIQAVQQTRQEAKKVLAPIEKEIEQQRKVNKIKKRLVMEPLKVKFPEELPSSMRQLAPEGNLVTDRFRSLIERGVVEATTHKMLSTEVKGNNRKKGKSVKPKIKLVEKYSYKDFK